MDSLVLRILVVDDDQDSRKILSSLARRSGLDTSEAESAEDGLEKALAERPDLLLIKESLPTLGGMELVQKIRAAAPEYQPYCLLRREGGEEWSQDLPVDDLLVPPLRPETLVARLRAGQRIVHLQRENARYLRELHEYSEELICSNLRLRELSMTDHLTGLPNRRYSMELMQHEWSSASQKESSLCCMVIDLDGLKQINDEQGLERGDVVLKTVAAIMRRYLPPQDTVCRISGDEFLVICPGATLNSVMARGTKIVRLVASFHIQAHDYPLSLSIGVAEKRGGVTGPQDLIRLAELAMHRAKAKGRNHVLSGHRSGLRVVRTGADVTEEKDSRPRKSRKQFPLWRQSEGLEMAGASA